MPRVFREFWAAALIGVATAASAADVNPEQILQFKPRRNAAEIETPAAADLKQCRVEAERRGKASGWVLYGPQGQVLRRFMDTNADDEVDEFRYFNQGQEVYRELDTNANKKPDQFRWLGSGGTRWGIDSNEDGRVDKWNLLSAEEATLEAVKALVAKDPVALQALLVNAEDLRSLGVSQKVADRLLSATTDVPGKLTAALASTRTIQPTSEWERFDCSTRVPSLLGAFPGKWDRDLFVYENVMAMVANGQDHGFVQIGELVRVGDTWKLTRIPQPIEGDNLQLEGGVLLQESLDAGSLSPNEGLSPEAAQLVEKLKQLDDAAPDQSAALAAVEQYNLKRADLVQQLAKSVTSEKERDLWWRQLIEGVAAETHKGAFPNGAERLAAIEKDLTDSKVDALVPFTRFRRLLVDFASRMQSAEQGDRQKIQEKHLQDLRDFVQEFPKSEEAPEAMWQVATTIEFNGNLADATKWYEGLSAKYPASPAGKRAKGAAIRLALKGNDLVLSGPALGGRGTVDVAQLKGKVVAVVFWASWFKPAVDEMPQLAELYAKFKPQGFEIVGVNLDTPETPVVDLLRQQKATWPQIQEPGGMEAGKLAIDFGIIAPGTMFLVGKDGKVISNSASIEDLKKLVPELIAK